MVMGLDQVQPWGEDPAHPWGPWRYDPALNILVPLQHGKPVRDLAITPPTRKDELDHAVQRLQRLGADVFLIGRFKLAAVEWREFMSLERYRFQDRPG